MLKSSVRLQRTVSFASFYSLETVSSYLNKLTGKVEVTGAHESTADPLFSWSCVTVRRSGQGPLVLVDSRRPVSSSGVANSPRTRTD